VDTAAITQEVLTQIDLPVSQPEALVPPILEETAVSNDFQTALVDLYQQANPAVVYILVPPLGSGSGFVFNEEGYIVTNNHVVDGGGNFEVVFADGLRLDAELIGQNVDSDLAVIKVDGLPENVKPLPLAEVQDLQVGQFVVAIGNPFGEQGSMSLGIVSGLGRSLPSRRGLGGGSSYSLPQVIQTDAPINPGNSGGPLLNLEGEVVGVNSAIASATGTNSGVGFSIPVSAVKRIIPSLIEAGTYVFPYMGVGFDDEVSLNEQSIYGLSQTKGAYVLNITEGSPAEASGLIAANPDTGRGGDLIIEIDGQAINNFSDLNSYLVFDSSVGETIQMTILRDGEEVILPLVLGERP
jgi:2-alkenal reductase